MMFASEIDFYLTFVSIYIESEWEWHHLILWREEQDRKKKTCKQTMLFRYGSKAQHCLSLAKTRALSLSLRKKLN